MKKHEKFYSFKTRIKLLFFGLAKKISFPLSLAPYIRGILNIISLFYFFPSSVVFERLKLNGVPIQLIKPKGSSNLPSLLYLHGGGFLIGLNSFYWDFVTRLALKARVQCFLVNYALVSEASFPFALNQCIQAYQGLLQQGYTPDQIVLIGDSAGGNLVTATLLVLRERGIPLPSGAILLSPWLDLSLSGESLVSRDKMDPILPTRHMKRLVQAYCGKDAFASHPLVSPLFADLKGLPPLLIQVGTYDVLFDDSLHVVAKAEEDGVKVKLEIEEGMVHAYPILFPELPQSAKALESICQFIRQITRIKY